jgi:predicted phosphodiesterase
MQYAILSDPHANLEALTATLAAIDAAGVDEIICLGDLVGYYANPNECVDLIRRRGIRCVAGNHDTVATGRNSPTHFGQRAQRAIAWTREQLTADNLRFLADLPITQTIEDRVFLVHGAAHPTPNENTYLSNTRQAEASFLSLSQFTSPSRLCFFGHTHRALVYTMSANGCVRLKCPSLRLRADTSYLINPGSVGQPRDQDPRASFVVYDSTVESIRFHRVAFDWATAERKAHLAGLVPSETYLSRAQNMVRRWIDTGVDWLDRYHGRRS